jgi:nucleotide-binding universal stress UspA family protein
MPPMRAKTDTASSSVEHVIEQVEAGAAEPEENPVRPISTIVLATDLSPASTEATSRAVDLADRLGARLLIVNVLEKHRVSGSGSHDRVDQARAEREAHLVTLVRDARDASVNAEFLVWEGDPGTSIAAAAEAENADMVVVGTRGRSGAERMILGSVSDHVVRNAPCPVLVVRPTARRSPDSAT